MAAKRSKYDSYDDESKGRLQKVFKLSLIHISTHDIINFKNKWGY